MTQQHVSHITAKRHGWIAQLVEHPPDQRCRIFHATVEFAPPGKFIRKISPFEKYQFKKFTQKYSKNFPKNEKFPPPRAGAHEEDSAPLRPIHDRSEVRFLVQSFLLLRFVVMLSRWANVRCEIFQPLQVKHSESN